MDRARLTAMVFVWPEGAFRLIFHKLHIASIAPVHVLRIIPVLKFRSVIPSFRNRIICAFDWFRNTAGTYAWIGFFLNSLIVPGRFTPAGIAVIRRAWPQGQNLAAFYPASLPLWSVVSRSGPVRQPVNGFIGALILLQYAFTQYPGGRVLLLRGVGGNWGCLFGCFGSAPHRLAIVVTGHLGKLCQGFRPFALQGLLINGFFVDEFIVRLQLLSFRICELSFLARWRLFLPRKALLSCHPPHRPPQFPGQIIFFADS